jgi:hypothetical protein
MGVIVIKVLVVGLFLLIPTSLLAADSTRLAFLPKGALSPAKVAKTALVLNDAALLKAAVKAVSKRVNLMVEMQDEDGTRFHYLALSHGLFKHARYVRLDDGSFQFDPGRLKRRSALAFHRRVVQAYGQLLENDDVDLRTRKG